VEDHVVEHDEALQRLSDWAEGRMPREELDALEFHLARCEACREVSATVREIVTHARPEDVALFTPHPSSDRIAGYADPAGLSIAERAEIHDHVRICPTCRAEVGLVRRALEARSPRRLRFPSGRLVEALSGTRWLAPALAGLTLIMAYPAYLGVFGERGAPATSEGSGAIALVVRATTRDAGTIPSITEPPRALVPILVDLDLSGWFETPETSASRIEIRLAREGQVEPVWSTAIEARAVWDPANRVVTLLVPSATLPAGSYVLSLRSRDPGAHEFEGAFRVLPAPGRP
jgi:hypothetical protein